ncbi:DUF861 domain-containing protein [Iocasia frigidifontis]|uniref:DUF861 domain-containing protein n=1 Tax=Iocasia fonsfrigidae TaxID=2682810 RepID=A0A8A7KFB8_9FIRM|nr:MULTISPECIES: cupin domain-containing protein [Halanaerobiaceae]AZO95516.1 DUF861 domain-containing protein [Halocella sp. SP3-1]QTL98388.1 DUF861 domain-containing protein [Iocasia fonsfrigidae]
MKITVEKPSEDRLKELGVKSWPVWEKEASEFPWYYDEEEVCYLLEGEVIVETDGQKVEFSAGELVTFPKGLDCFWKIKKDVKKHYKFA